MPDIPKDLRGLDRFRGKVMHSHDYRVPEAFTGQKVLVLGAGPSGTDISIELSRTAKEIVLCYNGIEPFPNLPDNIRQELSAIKQIGESEVEFESGNRQEFDAIVLCTGYKFNTSFLDESCAISVNQVGRVKDVYMHLINIEHPSMAVMAIPFTVVPFPLYQLQVSVTKVPDTTLLVHLWSIAFENFC